MISYKEAIQMWTLWTKIWKKQTHFLQFLVKGLKKALNVYFVIKIWKKSRSYVRFVGKDLKNMYQVAQKFSLNVTGTMWD